MITNNYRNLIKAFFAAAPTSRTYNLQVKRANGQTRYLNLHVVNSWPVRVTDQFTTNAVTGGEVGVAVGSGTTPATPEDYTLESQITSGISASMTTERGLDNSGNPYTQYTITISNTSAADVTIGEIGWFQAVSCYSQSGSTTQSVDAVMFDRTVLSSPVTISAGGFKALRYTLTATDPS